MDAVDRSECLRTIMWCDQFEAAIASGDEDAIAAGRRFAQDWSRNMQPEDLLTFIQSIRALAQQHLRGESDGQ